MTALTPRATSFENWFQTQRWFDWKNESDETCPALGMIQLKPFTIDDTADPESFFMDGGKPVWYGTVPNIYGQELQNPALLAFNGMGAVDKGKRGLATMHPLSEGSWIHGTRRIVNPWIPNLHGKSHQQIVGGAVGNARSTMRDGRLRYHNASAVRVRQQEDPNYITLGVTNKTTGSGPRQVLSGASLIGTGYWGGTRGLSGHRFGVVPGDADSEITGVTHPDDLMPHYNNAGAETGDPEIDPLSRGLYLRDGGIYHGIARLNTVGAVWPFSELSVTLTYDAGSGPVDTAFAARVGGLEDVFDNDTPYPGTRYFPRQICLPFLLQLQPASWINFRVNYEPVEPDTWTYELFLQMRWQSQALPRYADA